MVPEAKITFLPEFGRRVKSIGMFEKWLRCEGMCKILLEGANEWKKGKTLYYLNVHS
ncbi:hypothetical protein Bcoa_2042 [Heyndrickxia coagulans 36D1]|jgi:hypothetical protein|nr:hypothetical protein Bcoa_2042 [Heyndrickxia coagulans 36D1]AJO21675.1 hypothetical protein SB48_HM08orf01353 [Heyndrickxia coagulans]